MDGWFIVEWWSCVWSLTSCLTWRWGCHCRSGAASWRPRWASRWAGDPWHRPEPHLRASTAASWHKQSLWTQSEKCPSYSAPTVPVHSSCHTQRSHEAHSVVLTHCSEVSVWCVNKYNEKYIFCTMFLLYSFQFTFAETRLQFESKPQYANSQNNYQ